MRPSWILFNPPPNIRDAAPACGEGLHRDGGGGQALRPQRAAHATRPGWRGWDTAEAIGVWLGIGQGRIANSV